MGKQEVPNKLLIQFNPAGANGHFIAILVIS